MKPAHAYDGFIKFEERSADVYLELSIRFLPDIALSWFWVEMAMDEKQHAGLLQHCREAGICAPELPSSDQIVRLKMVFNDLEARLAVQKLDIDEAFEIAFILESSGINDIYNSLTRPIDGPPHVVRKKVDVSAANHFERLASAARRFNASPEIQQALADLSERGSEEPG